MSRRIQSRESDIEQDFYELRYQNQILRDAIAKKEHEISKLSVEKLFSNLRTELNNYTIEFLYSLVEKALQDPSSKVCWEAAQDLQIKQDLISKKLASLPASPYTQQITEDATKLFVLLWKLFAASCLRQGLI